MKFKFFVNVLLLCFVGTVILMAQDNNEVPNQKSDTQPIVNETAQTPEKENVLSQSANDK